MRIGVVTPVQGFSPFLTEALDAVVAQDPAPVDVVVVDDGSPSPVTLPAAAAERGVRLVRREQRGGPAAARNTGLATLDPAVTHVAFCDHDDVWLPGHLASCARAAARNPDAHVLTGHVLVVGPDGRPTGERWSELEPGRHAAPTLLPIVYERNPLCVSATIVARGALEEVGGFDERIVGRAEDLDLWIRLLATGAPLVRVDGPGVHYRRHARGMTQDVASLARALREVHRTHARRVTDPTARRTEAADLRALAAGLLRERDPHGAAAALAEAATLVPERWDERLRRLAVRVPPLARRMGRGDPYRGR